MSTINKTKLESLEFYLCLKYPITIYPDDEGGYVSEIKDIRLFVTLYAKSTYKMPRQHTSNPKIPKVSKAIASPFY